MRERRVALLFVDRIAHARLSEAFRGFAAIWLADAGSDIIEALADSTKICATVVLFEPSQQKEAFQAVEQLHQAFPDHPIIGYVDPRNLTSRFILQTGKADLSDLVLRDIDDSRAVLQRVLQNAEQRGTSARIAEDMSEGMPRDVRLTVQFICRHLREPLDVISIAAGLGMSRRTLHNRLGLAGSPSVSELVSWCRVVYTAHQIAVDDATLSLIATQLDMPSWRNLSSMVRRYLGKGAQQLRHGNAYEESLAAFRSEFGTGSPTPMVHFAAHQGAPAQD